MQPPLETHLETLLGKYLAGLAMPDEIAELRLAARENQELRRTMEFAEASAEHVRHSTIGDSRMIESQLPPFSRPTQLADTLAKLHANQRRTFFVSLALLLGFGAAGLLLAEHQVLGSPAALFSMLFIAILLGVIVWMFRRHDAIVQLSDLQDLDGGESWLAQVRRIDRTRRRYASRRTLALAVGVLLAGILATVVGQLLGSSVSAQFGKYAFLGSVFTASILWFRHRQYKKLPTID